MKTFGKHEIDDEFPFMVRSENGTQIDLVLSRLDTIPTFISARFAVEVVLLTSEQKKANSSNNFKVNLRKSLDDEHTPGIFNIIDIFSPNSLANANGV